MPKFKVGDDVKISRRRSQNGVEMSGRSNYPAKVTHEPIDGIQVSGPFMPEYGGQPVTVPLYTIELIESWPSPNKTVPGVPEDILDRYN